jgi:hypothetical protein
MKITKIVLLCAFLLTAGESEIMAQRTIDNLPSAVDYNYLSDHFKSPDNVYGTNCWWWWLNGHTSKDAITKELEAMKDRHFHGAMVFDAGGQNERGNKNIPQGPLFGSKEWNELFVFALDEAKRLGLELGFNIMSGWNLGGPCITPEYAAKKLVFTETKVKGWKEAGYDTRKAEGERRLL